MARRGRPRKSGTQTPCGRLRKSPIAREDIEKSVVMNQPHRRGEQSQLAESSLGRLVLRMRLPQEIFHAAISWAKFTKTYLAVRGVPLEARKGDTGSTFQWPSEQRVLEWGERIDKVETDLKAVSRTGFSGFRMLAIFEREIDPRIIPETVAVLKRLCELTWLPSTRTKLHPFGSSATESDSEPVRAPKEP